MTEHKTGRVNEHLLVGVANSSRLAKMREKAGLAINKPSLEGKQNKPQFADGLNQQTIDALQQAWALVEEKMADIFNAYPAGKKETFFKLKYGVNSEKIKTMSIKQVFVLLKLDSSIVKNFRLIEKLDSKGKTP